MTLLASVLSPWLQRRHCVPLGCVVVCDARSPGQQRALRRTVVYRYPVCHIFSGAAYTRHGQLFGNQQTTARCLLTKPADFGAD